MKLSFSFFIALLNCTGIFAQYKQMLHKPYIEKVEDIHKLYHNTINNGIKDSLSIALYTKEMGAWALAHNDKELALEAELLKAYSYLYLYGNTNPELVHNLIEVAQKGKDENFLNIEERAVNAIAKYYWGIKNYEKAFVWLLSSAKILEHLEPNNYPNMAAHLNFIGLCYYYFEDYEEAAIYLKKSSKLKKTDFNTIEVTSAQNTLGLCYQNLGELDLSDQCFLAIIKNTVTNSIWKGIASGNLGFNYYLREEFDKAIPLFETDIAEALKQNDYGLATGSLIPLSDIYLKQQNYKEAKRRLDEASKYIQQSGETDRLRKLYPIMSKWYAANYEPNMSIAYLDSSLVASKAYNEKYNGLQLLRANQKVEASQKELEIEKLNTESQLKLTQRNFIIILVSILLLASILGFWFRNKYLLKEQQIKELALENAKKALSNAKTQLENLTLKVRKDTNRIIELEKMNVSDIDQNLLSQLKSKSILTQDDWTQYQDLFKEVYPTFFPLLLASYPNLSQAELRYLCLIKLQLTNNEMALLLGVSSNSMRVTKHRLRNKLKIESQEELQFLIQGLGAKPEIGFSRL